jgi:hypothetical protein
MKFFLFLPLILFAFYPDFRPCYEKFKDKELVINNLKVSFYSDNCDIYDKFTHMCLNYTNKRSIKFYRVGKLGWWLASVKKREIYVGNYAKKSLDLYPAQLSVKVANNSIITDMFCRAIGIGSKDGFFLPSYITHFAKYRYWGDVGIVVGKDFRVKYVDPFFADGFKLKEEIKTINGKKATFELWNRYVTLAKEGSIVYINGKKLKVRKRVFGFTPLSYFGVYVDKNLKLRFCKKIKDRYFVSDGAKLISINSKKISSYNELLKVLSTTKNVTISVDDKGIILKIDLR